MNAPDAAAWWGAALATIVFGWDIYKWLTSGAKITLSATGNMQTLNLAQRRARLWRARRGWLCLAMQVAGRVRQDSIWSAYVLPPGAAVPVCPPPLQAGSGAHLADLPPPPCQPAPPRALPRPP
jgi:hypothetical protein